MNNNVLKDRLKSSFEHGKFKHQMHAHSRLYIDEPPKEGINQDFNNSKTNICPIQTYQIFDSIKMIPKTFLISTEPSAMSHTEWAQWSDRIPYMTLSKVGSVIFD